MSPLPPLLLPVRFLWAVLLETLVVLPLFLESGSVALVICASWSLFVVPQTFGLPFLICLLLGVEGHARAQRQRKHAGARRQNAPC